MKIDNRHAQKTDDATIAFTEKGRTIRFSNPDRLTCYKVDIDGGVITDSTRPKCDKLLIVVKKDKHNINEREQEHFVELKGCDVAHAIEQIESTIPDLWINKTIALRCSYIVCSKVSPKLTTRIQTWKSRFNSRYNSQLFIKEKHNPTLKRR